METRLIVAYILIAGLVAALVAAGIMIRRKRERDRQMKRGRRTTPR
jgi:LPXTG-motif cell wall-anchored protein